MDGPRNRTTAGQLATTARVESKAWNRPRPRPGAVFWTGIPGDEGAVVIATRETRCGSHPKGAQLEIGQLVRAAATMRSPARLAPAMFRDTGPSSSSASGPET